MSYPCPCCLYLTFDEEPPGTYEICPVCGWEDDEVQFNDPSFSGGANNVSLSNARANYKEFEACEQELVSTVRAPLEDEIP